MTAVNSIWRLWRLLVLQAVRHLYLTDYGTCQSDFAGMAITIRSDVVVSRDKGTVAGRWCHIGSTAAQK